MTRVSLGLGQGQTVHVCPITARPTVLCEGYLKQNTKYNYLCCNYPIRSIAIPGIQCYSKCVF